MLKKGGCLYCWLLTFLVVFLPLQTMSVSLAEGSGKGARERVTTEGEGQAGIVNQDLSRARQAAMEDALGAAFEVALLETVPAGVSLAEHRRILKELLPKKKRFLLQYRILSEMPAVDLFFVTVEATFSNSQIQEELVSLGVLNSGDETEEEVRTIRIRVSGISSFRWYHDLLFRLREGSDRIESVNPYEIFGTEMVLAVEFKGDINGLTEALLTARFDDFTIRLDQTGEEEIAVSLISYEEFTTPDPGSPLGDM